MNAKKCKSMQNEKKSQESYAKKSVTSIKKHETNAIPYFPPSDDLNWFRQV